MNRQQIIIKQPKLVVTIKHHHLIDYCIDGDDLDQNHVESPQNRFVSRPVQDQEHSRGAPQCQPEQMERDFASLQNLANMRRIYQI